MNQRETSQNKILWGSIGGALLLLSLFPFAAHENGIFAVFRSGNLSSTIWFLFGQMPMLAFLVVILAANAFLPVLALPDRLKHQLALGWNLVGVLVFILQFVWLTPKIRLGTGSFLLFFALLLCLSRVLSRLGLIMGDTFISGSLLSISVLLVVFILFPLLVMLMKSVVGPQGFQPATFLNSLRAYPSTMRIVKNSLLMAGVVGVLSTAFGLAFALVAERSRFRYKFIVQGFSILPMITPPFVIGLAIIFMLGRTGFVSNKLLGLRSNFIFGFPGIVLAQTLSFAPTVYLLLAGVVRSLDPAMEEASYTLRASRWYTFRTIIWPLLRPGIANAFLLSVIESLADFANPILLGGDFDVLATSIYLAIIGRYDEVLAASLGIVLLAMTLVIFMVQRYWIGKRSYVTVTGKPSRPASLPLPNVLDSILIGIVLVWTVLTIILYGSVFIGGFVKLWGINYTPTLSHYKHFLTDGWDSYITTIKLSVISAPLTAVLGILIAYLVSRYRFWGRELFEFTSMLSFAIPGTVIGIGYVMAFNVPPLLFTGTAAIIVVCFIFRNMPVAIRSSMASLQQIDRSLEESSITLGASNLRTFNRIVLPLIRPAVFSGLVFSFIRAMTAISAVIFLVTARTNLATTVILGRIEGGSIGLATAYCTIMIVTMVIAIVVMHLIVRRMTGVGNVEAI